MTILIKTINQSDLSSNASQSETVFGHPTPSPSSAPSDNYLMSPLTKDPDALRCVINLIFAVFSFLSLFSFLGGGARALFPNSAR